YSVYDAECLRHRQRRQLECDRVNTERLISHQPADENDIRRGVDSPKNSLTCDIGPEDKDRPQPGETKDRQRAKSADDKNPNCLNRGRNDVADNKRPYAKPGNRQDQCCRAAKDQRYELDQGDTLKLETALQQRRG